MECDEIKAPEDHAANKKEVTQEEYVAEVNRMCAELSVEQDMQKLMFAARDDLLHALEQDEDDD